MRAIKLLFGGLSSVALMACANTVPITVVGSHAMSLRGTIVHAPHGSLTTLQATDGTLTCSGSSQSLVINITCNDGRKGVANLENHTYAIGNDIRGYLHLEDGTDAEIVMQSPDSEAAASSVSQNANTAPRGIVPATRIIIPATGGPPVIGIPIGGDLYIPVTGGTPVVGTPVSP